MAPLQSWSPSLDRSYSGINMSSVHPFKFEPERKVSQVSMPTERLRFPSAAGQGMHMDKNVFQSLINNQ